MTGMSEHGFASLTPGLLARKGRARPAMRRQDAANFGIGGFPVDTARIEDLGWNDWGQSEGARNDPERCDRELAGLPETAPLPGPSTELPASAPVPDVVRQIEAISERMNRGALPTRSSGLEGRRAAFTLRLDAERHFRLRMAGVLLNRSAQVLVTEALDKFLSEMPEIAPLTVTVGGRG
ncbi:hypothetical protein ACLIMP_13980 [Novosphingobium aerophilum]|nr:MULTISPECIES: hypothetical protein [unclassified Novosphingobium]TCM38088.1 hypothetical protein EDF59_109149 [Novosphingobium sp. ST904]WRT92364.1 hypothetical protein U9J33_14305 [Novosphingobium sp. RL4]